MSECSSVLSLAVLGELLVTTREWIPLSWRGRSPVFCSLDLADTVLTDLRMGEWHIFVLNIRHKRQVSKSNLFKGKHVTFELQSRHKTTELYMRKNLLCAYTLYGCDSQLDVQRDKTGGHNFVF